MNEDTLNKWAKTSKGDVFIGVDSGVKAPKKSGKKGGVAIPVKHKDGTMGTRLVYPKDWTADATLSKFDRVKKLAKKVDKIESGLRAQLAGGGKMTAKKELAVVMLIIRETAMRVGGGKGDKPGKTGGDDTYGATTLQKKHAKVEGDTVVFDFKGKAGVMHKLTMKDKLVAGAIRGLIGGDSSTSDDPLFPQVTRPDVAAYMKKFGKDFTAKDFRTLNASEEASRKVLEIIARETAKPLSKKMSKSEKKKYAKELTKEVADAVSKKLGNTPSVALSGYIHPDVIEHMLKIQGLGESKMSNFLSLIESMGQGDDQGSDDIEKRYPNLVGTFGVEVVRKWMEKYSNDNDDDDDLEEDIFRGEDVPPVSSMVEAVFREEIGEVARRAVVESFSVGSGVK